ncbi:MAG: hypothetical protein ACQ9MH_01150 [Nitrospinales bacterium]
MEDTLSKEIECVLCDSDFTPIIEPEEEETYYDIHCSSCVKWVRITRGDSVRATIREVLGVKGEALALAIETMLAPCPCGAAFRHDAGRRCLECIVKIKSETKRADSKNANDFHCIWNIEKLKELEPKIFGFIFQKLESKEDTLAETIRRFDSGEIDAETYMESIEDLQFRESRHLSVIKVWAMILGPEMAFRAADENDLVEKFGTRILITLATGLEMGYGQSLLTTLTKEVKKLDGPEQKELQTFIRKIAGGF